MPNIVNPSPELTVDHQSAGASVGRLPLALATDEGLATADDLRTLLLRRLRFLCPMLVALLGIVAVLILINWSGLMFRIPTAWSVFPCLLIGSLLALLVWTRPQLTLWQLRAIELILVAILASRILVRSDDAFWGASPQSAFQSWRETGDMDRLSERLRLSAYPMCLTAAIYIVAYGVCIPNTWRRCVLVVGLLGSLPPIMWVVGCVANDLPWDACFNSRIAFIFLDLAFAVALAVYGCHRVEKLRHEALQARRLGQYILGHRLGAGGMGEVYLADHVLLRRPCAIKLIRPDRAGDPRNLQRFEREVQVTATLTHPNTVQIYDYGHAKDGTFYYVMEYLPGMTLDDLVKRNGPLSPTRAIHFLRQICGALGEAHGRGLIHRDIKPGNVMICERGGVADVAKLLDFGLVLPLGGDADGEKLTQDGAITGTPAYLSPEQAGGQETLDARSDIYSVGVLAYFLLSGQPPFGNRSGIKMLAAHLYEEPEPLSRRRSDVPRDLEAVIFRCLAKRPEARYPDVASLDAALTACRSESHASGCDATAESFPQANAGIGTGTRTGRTESIATSDGGDT